jgi:HAD superfamily hydrolase (TIGR01509 family)
MRGTLGIHGLLLDMDGVLLDTERVAERCWRAAEEETGWRMPDGLYFTLIGQSMRRIEPRLREVMDPGCDVGAFLQAANRHYDAALTQDAIPVKPGARALLEHLSRQGIPVCLATSTFRALAERKLAGAGLGQWLPLRVCGDEVGHSKPAPDIYLEAARRIGFAPHQLLAVEDSENGLRAALDAGCRVAHVPDIAPVAEAVQARADRVYADLATLHRALLDGAIRTA